MKNKLQNLLDSLVIVLDHYDRNGHILDEMDSHNEIMQNLKNSYDVYKMSEIVNNDSVKSSYTDLMQQIEETYKSIKLQSEGLPNYVLTCDPDFAEKLNMVMSAQVNDSI